MRFSAVRAAAAWLAAPIAILSCLASSSRALGPLSGRGLAGIPFSVAASADLTLDRDGKPRSGNGSTGYAICAFERN